MRWRYLTVILLAVILLTIYLNRAYAYYFDNIGQKDLQNPNIMTKYTLSSKQSKVQKNIVYAALGDSLTAGVGVSDFRESFPYLVSQHLNQNFSQVTLFDYGFPGTKVASLTGAQIPQITNLYPDYITINVGINDLLQDRSPQDFQNDYSQMLQKISTLKNAKIYIINIPYLGSSKTLLPPYNFLLDLRIRQFNQIISDLVKNYPFYYIDLYEQTKQIQKDPNYYSADGFHPGSWGYTEWGRIINARLD